MLSLVYGLILILFDHTISVGSGQVGLFPSFLGFGLIAITFRNYKTKSKYFDGLLYPTAILMVLSTFTYITDIFGLVLSYAFISTIIKYAVVIGTIVVVYGIVLGLRDIEADEAKHLDSDKPYAAALYFTIIQIVVLISPSDIITAIALLARIVSIVYLVYTLYKSIALYNQKNSSN